MAKAGPKKVLKYSDEFRLTAVKLSQLEGVEVGDVAKALDIHPWMLSKWRTLAKQGLLRGKAAGVPMPAVKRGELKELRRVKKELARMRLELEILKKAIRLSSDPARKSSRS
ncbi:MAG: transposase [Gammaproteobacteria bacterium]